MRKSVVTMATLWVPLIAILLQGASPLRAADPKPPAAPMRDADILSALQVPDGLEVTVWAKSPMFSKPTRMDVDERGRIWVAEAVNYRGFNTKAQNPMWREAGDRIVILEDTDGDGKADSSKVFVQDKDLTAPLGVSVIGDKVIVSCSPNLIVYTRNDKDEVVKKEIFLTGFGGFDHDHSLHNLQAGPDGRWYFNVGNAGPHIVKDKAGWTLCAGSWYTGGTPYNTTNTSGLKSDDGRIWTGGVMMRMNPDGTGLTPLGHGFRNPYGTCVDSFGELWMNDNDDTQSCRTTWLMAYSDLGYNSKDGSRSWQADKRPAQSVRTAHWRQDDPGVIPSGHVYGNGAPTGITYYEGGALGDKYASGLLLSCEAGQNVVWGYLRKPQGAGYALEPFPFLRSTNDQDPNYDWGRKEADPRKWFRPSDVTIGTDGCVYICDWWDQIVGGHQMMDKAGGGTIYRIAPKGQKASSPKYDTSTVAGLIETLKSPAKNVRNLGFEGLKKRSADALPAVQALLKDPSRFVQGRAIFLLAQLGEPGRKQVETALTDADPEKRVAAYRALQLLKPDDWLSHATTLARDDSPAVRREVALSLRGLAATHRDILTDIASRYDGQDRWYLEALGTGCEGAEEATYAHLLGKMGSLPLKWDDKFADIAWRLHPITSIPAHKDRALSPQISIDRRHQAIDAIAFIADKAAALAMVEIANKGPEDLRSYASWWVENRATNDWKSYGISGKAGLVIGDVGVPSGQALFASPVLKRGGVDVDVDITGATRLYLVATDGGDTIGCDWADWIEPTLFDVSGKATRLTDLKWTAAGTGWGDLNLNKNCKGMPLKVGGKVYDNGIGGHANLAIVYDISGKNFTRFKAFAGVDNGAPDLGGSDYKIPSSTVRFFVYAEGTGPKDAGQKRKQEALALRQKLLDAKDDKAKQEIALALAKTEEGGRILIALAEETALPDSLKQAVAKPLHENPDHVIRALADRHFPLKAEGAPPPVEDLLKLDGNPARGREVFFGQKAACATCHRIGDQGKDIGPDLTNIQEKYDRPTLYDQILDPSKAIVSGFETYLVETKDGDVLTGFLVQDADPYIIRDTLGEKHAIPRNQIKKKRLLEESVMPNNIAAGITPQELADVVSFLQSKKK